MKVTESKCVKKKKQHLLKVYRVAHQIIKLNVLFSERTGRRKGFEFRIKEQIIQTNPTETFSVPISSCSRFLVNLIGCICIS